MKLFAPGPVQVPKNIRQTMAVSHDTHRSQQYQKLHKSTKTKLQALLQTKNDILFWSGSGSLVMEACIKSFLVRSTTCGIILSCGGFGERWIEMAQANQRQVSTVTLEWGAVFTSEIIKEEYQNQGVVFVTMNESSTGVMNSIPMIRQAIGEAPLLIVDAVSCMGGTEIKVDEWGIDVCIASTQKCFGVPPGLAVSSVSARALEWCKGVPTRGWYTDFVKMSEFSAQDYTPSTTNIPCLQALHKSLELIEKETARARYHRHLQNVRLIRQWAINTGFELFAPVDWSPTITVIINTRQIDVDATIAKLYAKHGYKFANGYGKLKDKTFRIAAMGWITPLEVEKFLAALTDVIF